MTERPATIGSILLVVGLAIAILVLMNPVIQLVFKWTAAGHAAAQEATISGTAAVIDADTLRVGPVRIRLHGIDALEDNQLCVDKDKELWDCGKMATAGMNAFIANKTITCISSETDKYGRLVAKCFIDGIDIGAEAVKAGIAVAYRRYSKDYVEAETIARSERIGIWSSYFMMPWEHRELQKTARED